MPQTRRIAYTDEARQEEEKKKTAIPQATLPGVVNSMDVVKRAQESAIPVEPARSTGFNTVRTSTGETYEMQPPYIPRPGEVRGYGPTLPADVRSAANVAMGDILTKRYTGSKALGGRTPDEIIDQISRRYGGMENLRSRASSYSRDLDVSERTSEPQIGSFMQDILNRGPWNRNERILMRRYISNIPSRMRDVGRREGISESMQLGQSAVPEMLGDVLSAQNVAENIGLDAQTRLLGSILGLDERKAAELSANWRQLVGSGTALAQTETTAASGLMRTGANRTPFDYWFNGLSDFEMEDYGLVDEEGNLDEDRINQFRTIINSGYGAQPTGARAIGTESATPAPTGRPRVMERSTAPTSALPQQITVPKGSGAIPSVVITQAQQQGIGKHVDTIEKDNKTFYVFEDENGVRRSIVFER